VAIDLIPFGGLERDGHIRWPGDGQEMNMSGYGDAFALATEVRLAEDLSIHVVTVPMLVVLKLFAAADRAAHTDRDLSDLRHVFDEYPTAGREAEVLARPLVGMADALDWDHLAPFLLGADIGVSCSATTLDRLGPVLDEFTNPFGRFAHRLARPAFDAEEELRQRRHAAARFMWLAHGIRLARPSTSD
jgi:predicted nucleotidyltransferase